MYTLDTNSVIYYMEGDKEIVKLIRNSILAKRTIYISVITEAELMSWPPLTEEEILIIEDNINIFSSLAVDHKIARIASFLRRKYSSIKLPDAIIAATAIFTGTTLITRNIKDFQKIKELKLQKI